MEYYKIILATLALIGVGYLVLKLVLESGFEKLDKDAITLSEWSYQNPDQDDLSEAIQSTGIAKRMKDIYPSLSERYQYTSFNEKYFVVLTGYNTLDDGIWFFATPTYTRVLIVDRNTEKVVLRKLFFKDLTNAKLIDDELYFRYDNPFLWELVTNFYRLDKLDSELNKLGKTSLNLN
ncbi:MAG: hypothetical protein ED557_10685 [Balneola sp.]|nr:MAG: hypothetical protein ED557_10685 [Balneola sp.]